ncbi:hypothetical protein [Streptomyces sp. NPDC006463]|uniref:hypothetical protein n=1 Tax=Streptomyces sp. NPDC006463 TaxID=3364746 RepID=UPI0036D16243
MPEYVSEVSRLEYSHGGPAEVREHAEGWARTTALTPARRGDLVLADPLARRRRPSLASARGAVVCG